MFLKINEYNNLIKIYEFLDEKNPLAEELKNTLERLKGARMATNEKTRRLIAKGRANNKSYGRSKKELEAKKLADARRAKRVKL